MKKVTMKNSIAIQDGLNIIHLTIRESECLFYFALGYTIKEVARVLKISSRTVERHLENMKIKTDTQHKADLIKKYYALSLKTKMTL